MAIYALGDREPTLGKDSYVHPDATVIGAVTLGDGVSVWPGAVLRGDYGAITIGARSKTHQGLRCRRETSALRVAGGTSPTAVTHQDPLASGNRLVSVCVAPIAALPSPPWRWASYGSRNNDTVANPSEKIH